MRVIALSMLAVALLLGHTGSAGAQKDKKHEYPTEFGGKTADAWIAAIAQPDRSESVKALQAVMVFGPKVAMKAVPVILKELKKHQPNAVPKKKIDASFVSQAPAALAIIIRSQEKLDAEQLKEVKEIVKVLKAQLNDPQITIRYRTLMALTQFGTFMNDAVEEIVARVRDPETWEIRHAAVTALGAYHYDHKKEAPPKHLREAILKYGLHDLSTSVRLAALNSIERLGLGDLEKENVNADVEKAISELLFPRFGQGEKDPTVRITAYLVSYGIDKTKNKSRREAIGTYLSYKWESAVRLQAINALNRIGKDAKDQLKKFESCLDAKQDMPVRLAAIQAIAHIGSYSEEEGIKAAKMIEDYASDKDANVRGTTLLALGGIGKGAKTKIGLITKYITDNKEELPVRLAGFQALGTMGPIAKTQYKLVADYALDKNAEKPLRLAAIQSLAQIEPGVSKPLVDCLQDKDKDIISAAVLAFAGMGKEGLPAVPHLTVVANDTSYPVSFRDGVQKAIDHIKDASKPKKKGSGK